jgi:hypothetical protein
MMRILLFAALWANALGVVGGEARAQALYRQFPQTGLWWQPAEPGSGWNVDLQPDGFMFVTMFTYDAAGMPRWYTMQGAYTEFSALEGHQRKAIGRLFGPLTETTAGTCFGCPYRAPNYLQSPLGDAELLFKTALIGEFSVGTYRIPLEYAVLGVPPSIEGDWLLAILEDRKLIAPFIPIRVSRSPETFSYSPPPDDVRRSEINTPPQLNRQWVMQCLELRAFVPLSDFCPRNSREQFLVEHTIFSQGPALDSLTAHFVTSVGTHVQSTIPIVTRHSMNLRFDQAYLGLPPREFQFVRLPLNLEAEDGSRFTPAQ